MRAFVERTWYLPNRIQVACARSPDTSSTVSPLQATREANMRWSICDKLEINHESMLEIPLLEKRGTARDGIHEWTCRWHKAIGNHEKNLLLASRIPQMRIGVCRGTGYGARGQHPVHLIID